MARPASASPAATSAREQAHAILTEGRFHSAAVPHPLHGVLEAIGEALEEALALLPDAVGSLGTTVPGGSLVVWLLLTAMLLALIVLLGTRGTRRALDSGRDAPLSDDARDPVSAAQLLREASAAERDGRAEDAVRLHFRRGLLLLLESERLDVAPAMLNTEVSRALRSELFDTLARTFEEIAYGGRPATAQDAQDSRRGWSALLKAMGA
jgi:hypothetical protein